MKLAEMQLKHYHFNRLLLESNEESAIDDSKLRDSPYREPDASKLKVSIVLGEPEAVDDGEEYFFFLTLGLEYRESDFPYTLDVEVDGFFTPGKFDLNDEEAQQACVIDAASMLYGSIREQLLMLSARHKYGPMMLPSVDFRAIGPVK